MAGLISGRASVTMIKVVAFSDTHGFHEHLEIPDGDLLIFAGDCSKIGTEEAITDFVCWLEHLPHKYKVMIAGNHDKLFERKPETARAILSKFGSSITYLESEMATIDIDGRSIVVYGEPRTPSFGYGWVFNTDRDWMWADVWSNVPKDVTVDILVSHGPPSGVCDIVPKYYGGEPEIHPNHVGCGSLTRLLRDYGNVNRVICGHIHEGHGHASHWGADVFNVSIMNDFYKPVNPVTVFEF